MKDELAPFMEMAKRYPMLSAEEEKRLVVAWQKRGDEQALDKLVGSHLRLAIRIARDNSGYGLPIGDLIGEGNVGLLQVPTTSIPTAACALPLMQPGGSGR